MYSKRIVLMMELFISVWFDVPERGVETTFHLVFVGPQSVRVSRGLETVAGRVNVTVKRLSSVFDVHGFLRKPD